MDLLDSQDELDRNHQTRLQVELSFAGLEQIFERRAEHIHYHHVEGRVRYAVVRANVVQAGHVGLPSHFVDKFTLPK